MANRIGIELLPNACRVIEIQPASGWFARNRPDTGPIRVKSFHDLPYAPESPNACAVELRKLLGTRRDIRLAMWGLRSSHQVFRLPQADTADLEVLARREARLKEGVAAPAASAASHADGVLVGDVIEGGRREVGYVSVPPAEIQGRLQPFVDAGLAFASVVTPAVGHALLARRRWGRFGTPAAAVLSVNARATALSVVRGGVVLFTREMPWGYETERAASGAAFDPAAFAARLASELRRSLVFLNQQTKANVGHVLLCGDVPDIRSLTGPLMHELSMEVETLDSLDEFDAARLPGGPESFRARIPALRTASALAAGPSPVMTLQVRDTGTSRLGAAFDLQARRRLAAAVLAALLIVGVAWGGVEWLGAQSRTRLDGLRRQVTTLGTDMQRLDARRQAAALTVARLAALEAFATQGPRLARVLESLAGGTPGDVVLTTMTMAPGNGSWRVTVNGQAHAETPALAQALFTRFLRGASSSPLGQPVRPPSMNVQAFDPSETLPDTIEPSGPMVAQATPRDDVDSLARPRNVILAEPGSDSTSDPRFARPRQVMAEPHWQLHPGGVPKDVANGIAAYNSEQAGIAEAARRTAARPPAPIERRAGSVLEFSVEFEVRK